jgi:Ca-activated chloride channel homolog
MTFTLTTPHLLWLLPLALVPFIPRRRESSPLSSLEPLRRLRPTWRLRFSCLHSWCAALTITLLVLLLADPVQRETSRTTVREGVDLMLVLDVSASLGATDIPPSRMVAARTAAADFLEERHNDRVGVILFSGVPVLLSPPVLDKGHLVARLRGVEADRSGTGTAIGDALATALARLKDSPAQSKAVILLTDGSSNRGSVTPRAAARAAAALGIRIYTIGFGSLEGSEIPLGSAGAPARLADGTLLRGALEEEPLIEIARLTGGQYFRAASGEALRGVYQRIDTLEKSPLEVKDRITDHPLAPLLQRLILLLLAAELLLFRLWLRIRPTGYLFDLVALAAFALLLIPPPGSGPIQRGQQSGPDLALAIDVSASMACIDNNESRLALAQREARTLLTALPNSRFSLTLIGGEGVVQAPLTEDREAILFFVDRLLPKMVASPGSAPEEGVLTALSTLSSSGRERAVILLSDGERTLPTAAPRLPQAIPVYTISLGSAGGSPVLDDNGAARRDRTGQPILSKRDEDRLRQIAEVTKGKLLLSQNGAPAALTLIERWRPPDLLAPPALWWLWAALGLLLLRQFPWSRKARGWSAWVPAFTMLTLIVSACGNIIDRGESDFDSGMRLAKNGAFAEAASAFARATSSVPANERGLVLYNQGTALLAAREAAPAVAVLEQALLLLPGDAAVRTNLALALRLLGDQPASGSGDGDKHGEEGSGDAPMNREQALQLVEAVKPQAFAEAASLTEVHERTVERDW